jgi:hypothetical protein
MQPTLHHLRDPAFWQDLAPSLHVGECGIRARGFDRDAAQLAERLRVEGYFKAQGDWGLDIAPMAAAARTMVAHDLPPVFCLVYDEFLAPFRSLAPLYQALLGDYVMLPACWVWYVDPAKSERGWRRHRDQGRKALFPDGSPKSLNTWFALSRADTQNGCVRLVPAHLDPTYNSPMEAAHKTLPDAFEKLAVPLEAQAGDFFVWNQAVLHWGGQSTPQAREPRISMAFECQRVGVPFQRPVFAPDARFTLDDRLRLIGKQILRYRHMQPQTPQMQILAQDLRRIG